MDWATMTPPEMTFRLVLVVLGVALATFIAWVTFRDTQNNLGCLPLILGALALTLIIGGIAGPEAVKAFWG